MVDLTTRLHSLTGRAQSPTTLSSICPPPAGGGNAFNEDKEQGTSSSPPSNPGIDAHFSRT
jgi:hypothetical protein